MMAKQFAKYQHNDDVLIFASGVSNSKETLVTTQPIFSLNTFVLLYNPEIEHNLK